MNIFNNKFSKIIVSAAFIVAVGVTTTASAFVALSNSTPTGNQSYGGTLGQFFHVDAPKITITGLGVYDSGQNGIIGSLSVKIWDEFGATVVPTVVFGGGSPQGSLIGTYRFQSITPVVLPTGKYLVGAWGFSGSDPNGNLNLPSPPAIVGNTGGGLVSYPNPPDMSYYSPYDNPGGIFPTTTTGVISNFQFAAGNFQFAVPEPETYLLMGSLLGGVMLLAWKRKRAKV